MEYQGPGASGRELNGLRERTERRDIQHISEILVLVPGHYSKKTITVK